MSHPNEDPIPHAARMRAIGDLLARGVRRLQELKGHDIRRRGGDEEILAVDPATCLDLQAESSVTVGHAAMCGSTRPLLEARALERAGTMIPGHHEGSYSPLCTQGPAGHSKPVQSVLLQEWLRTAALAESKRDASS